MVKGPYMLSRNFDGGLRLLNDGSVTISGLDEDGGWVPIARIPPQTEAKRGQGHMLDCPERDRIAQMIVDALNK